MPAHQTPHDHIRSDDSGGITLVELLVVVSMIAILSTMIGHRVKPTLERTGTANAAAVVALDLEQAVSLAARQRRPVRIVCDCANQSYSLTDRGTGAILFRRVLSGSLGGDAVTSLTFSVNPIDVFPSGLTSAALTVTVGTGSIARHVTMSSGSFVRIIR